MASLTNPANLERSDDTEIFIMCIDPGTKNFAFTVGSCNKDDLNRIENIPKNNRYNVDGTATDDFLAVLDQVYASGKIILNKNIDLTVDCKSNNDDRVFYNLYQALEDYADIINKCQYILIEQQMNFGKAKSNPLALKVAHTCFSYFIFKYALSKTIIDFPAYHKTNILGCPKNPPKGNKKRWTAVTKPIRKKWAVEKAIEILSSCEDEEALAGINKVKKKDDLCDTILMLQCAKYLLFVDKIYDI